MSAVVTTNRDGICGICQEEFGFWGRRFTHAGGEGHDGFHRTCLANWLAHHQTCPYDGRSIDPSSLNSRTERVRSALSNAACAVCFGATVAVGTFAAIELVLDTGMKIGAGVGKAVGEAVGVAEPGVGALQLLGLIAGAAGVIGIGKLALEAAGPVLGRGVDWILNRGEIDLIARQNILAGALTGIVVAVSAPTLSAFLTTTALVGGVATGILSLIR